MALRDKFPERVAPFLDPGETYQVAFPAQGGPNPMWSFVSSLIMLFMSKQRMVVVTDQGVYLCQQTAFTTCKPKKLIKAMPLGTALRRDDKKIWGALNVGGEAVWVHSRFAGDVLTADRLSREFAAAAADSTEALSAAVEF